MPRQSGRTKIHEVAAKEVIAMMASLGVDTSKVTPREAVEYCKSKMPLSSAARKWWEKAHLPSLNEVSVRNFERSWRSLHRTEDTSDLVWKLSNEDSPEV